MASTRFNNKEDQLYYIPCNFCSIVLAVCVPCSKIFDIVKVKCGHCTNMWPVNMGMIAGSHNSRPNSSTSHDSSSSPFNDQHAKNTSTNSRIDLALSSRHIPMKPPSPSIINNQKTGQLTPIFSALEKRKRVPSAYNQFIKQEIPRVKANNPNISHREAFSAAAKNWAHFPQIQMLETKSHQKKFDASCIQGSNKRLKSTAESSSI